MKDVPVRDTRNFALIGHAGDGKTSLGEALLHRAGAIQTLGRVDQGTSHLSYLPEEKERHHTLTSSVYAFDWSGNHLTLVDTPGDPNFIPDAEITVPALDGAVCPLIAAPRSMSPLKSSNHFASSAVWSDVMSSASSVTATMSHSPSANPAPPQPLPLPEPREGIV